MRINYNVSSIIAKNALNNNDMRLSSSTQRLSSGYKINSAKDDAAGLAISRKMNAQIKSLQQANKNANDGLSVVNTADGAMMEIHDILQRMNELSIQSANGTNSDSDREQIQLEIDQLIQEIDRIADTTQFNAQNLLDGSFAYKGYTNTENVKVMSYSDGVQDGIYIMDYLTYYHYEDKTTYSKGGEDTTDDRYGIRSADDIKAALYGTSEIDDYKQNTPLYEQTLINGSGEVKPFSESTRVTLEDDEYVILKADNDFEVKLVLNGSELNPANTIKTDITTTTVTTKCYHSVSVEAPDGNKYTILELNNAVETDENGNNVTNSGGEGTEIFTSSREAGLGDLEENFAEYFEAAYPGCKVDVTGFVIDDSAKPEKFTMKVSVTETDNTGNVTVRDEDIALTLYQETNPDGSVTNKSLDNYLYSTTETTKTTYNIGEKGDKEQSITLDLTGMGPMRLQVGANEGQIIEVEIPALNAVNLGVEDLDITTEASATAAIDIVGKAINQLSSVRAKIGAYANRIEHTITNLNTTEENMTASYSRIMDVDMATEMTEYSTVQILVQASTSMLSQANERPQQVLQLIQ